MKGEGEEGDKGGGEGKRERGNDPLLLIRAG